MVDDRREEERKDVALEVRWEGGSGHHTARVSDLSVGGCYLDTLGGANVGEVISLEIKMPDGGWLQLRGSVAFYHPGLGFSVCFTFLTEDEERRLAEIINS